MIALRIIGSGFFGAAGGLTAAWLARFVGTRAKIWVLKWAAGRTERLLDAARKYKHSQRSETLHAITEIQRMRETARPEDAATDAHTGSMTVQ